MKNFLTPLFVLFLILVLSSLGFGQGVVRDFTYYDDGQGNVYPPLTNNCTPGQGTALTDASAFLNLYWDNNGNGPDPSDVQPALGSDCYGCVNYNSFAINGESFVGLPGYFSTSAGGLAVSMNQPPEAPDLPRYYWRINAELGGDTVCWTSAVYTFIPGYEDIYLTPADLTCVSGHCPVSGTVPDAPTNVQATDDEFCMTVNVSWDHTGANVNGFSVYDETGFLGSVGGAARLISLQVTDVLAHNYFVRASNAVGESDTSNHDNGKAYLLRFANGPEGNLFGSNLNGQSFTIHFDRPEEICPSLDSLFMITTSGVIVDFLCVDSLTTEMTCTLPDLGAVYNLKLLLRSYYFSRPAMETDTTDSTFDLGPLAAGGRELLIPDRFSLDQNYPNPFNPTTTINFSVPFESDVRIDVYNIAGQMVKTLVSGSMTAGVHQITWDGRSEGGIGVTSGLYFYRMSGPGFVQTKKMLMMK